jgi:hypothetical protein
MASATAGGDRHRFLWSCTVGFAAAGAIFLWLLLGPDWDLFRKEPLGGFYETQARAWLHGHWNVTATGGVRFEAFVIHGRNYLYFGPWPALLRLPFVAFSHALDGRLTGISMLVAYVVFAVFASRFAWLTRQTLRGATAVSRLEAVGAAVLAFLLAAGSSIFFLASRTVVYHEAILWGVALTTAGLFYATRFALDGDRRSLLWAGVMATLAVMSRVSVGLAVVAALVLIAAARVVSIVRSGRGRPEGQASLLARIVGWPGVGDRTRGVGLTRMVLAIVVPLALYAYVNLTKFGSAFGLPLDKQFLLRFDPTRQAALHANPLTGFRFVTTTVVQYLRPDALAFDRLFPWVTFPGPARTFGGAHFATLDFTSSVTASMTALFVLWVIGVVASFRPARPEAMLGTAFRVPILAGLAGCVSVLAFGFIANRYLGDFIPAVVVGAVVGFHVFARWAAQPGTRRVVVRAAAGAMAALVVWTFYVNLGLALQYQRAYGIGVTDATRAGWLGFQLDLHSGLPSDVARAGAIPPVVGPNGQLLVVGACAGLAWSDGRQWHPVERTPATGRVHLGVQFPDARPGSVQPLVALGTATHAGLVSVRFQPGRRVEFEYSPVLNGFVTQRFEGPSLPYEPGRNNDVDVIVDPATPAVHVSLNGRAVLDPMSLGVVVVGGPVTVGRDPTGAMTAAFAGRVRTRATPTPLCDRLSSRRAGSGNRS